MTIIKATKRQYNRSISKQIQHRFEKRRTLRKITAVLYIVLSCSYLAWRATILNDTTIWLSIIYFIAEIFGVILGLVTILTSWKYKHREAPRAPEGLSVDVLVPTYKEPYHIIRRTVMAARDIDYPHKTIVLDDANRTDIKDLAKELGVEYLTRKENIDAKAGNLNYGLKQCQAEFVMVFDADHIAQPHALHAVLGFFKDSKTGMVQTPQDYYNTDAFQYFNSKKKGLWHDQSFFYNIAQACRDSYNGASCVGTGVVYRRSALDAIGGIPTATVTEDIHTSLKMHKFGYEVAYLNESIAFGVASSDLNEYYKTRHRWAHGNLHALVHENVIGCRGLNLKQRFGYLSLGLIYLEGWQQLMFFMIPIISLTFGIPPFEITVFNVVMVLLFPFLSYGLLQENGCGFARYWVNELFAIARWPVHIVATTGLLGWKIPWRSSAKNVEGQFDWKLVAPQLTVALLSLAAVIFAVIRLDGNYSMGPLFQYIFSLIGLYDRPLNINIHTVMGDGFVVDLVVIAGFWSLFNAFKSIVFIRKSYLNAKNSHKFFRFNIPFPLSIGSTGGLVTKISENWAEIGLHQSNLPIHENDILECNMLCPDGEIQFSLKTQKIISKTNLTKIEGDIIWNKESDKDRFANNLYSIDWHREFIHRNAYFVTLYDLIAKIFERQKDRQPHNRNWNALQLKLDGGRKYGIIQSISKKEKYVSGILFSSFNNGTNIKAEIFDAEKTHEKHFRIVKREYLSSLAEKGLNGMTPYRYRLKMLD